MRLLKKHVEEKLYISFSLSVNRRFMSVHLLRYVHCLITGHLVHPSFGLQPRAIPRIHLPQTKVLYVPSSARSH
jgi:hypothetical protein